MRKLLKKRLKNQKGFVSILVTILAIIGVVFVAYLLDSNTQSFVIREIEGIMDTSAMNTFNRTLSIEKLKDEVFGFDTGGEIKPTDSDGTYTLPSVTQEFIKKTYRDELNNQASTNSLILELKADTINLEFGKSSWGGGDSTKSRPYLVIDSFVTIKMKHSSAFDYSASYQNRQFASYKSGVTDVTIENLGTPQDGEMVMVVRCTSRLYHR